MKTDEQNKKAKKWVKPYHAFVRDVVCFFLKPYYRIRYRLTVEPFSEQGKRQYLILFNHQTFADQFFVGMAFRGAVYYLASEDIFSNGFLSSMMRFLVAPIPIKKQTVDIAAVRNCLRVAKEGGTIALAPKGNRTYSGKSEYIHPAIADLAKRLALPIAFFRIEGGYGVQPRWSDVVRKGRMRAYVSRVMEPEEYKDLSGEALLSVIEKELYVNEGVADQSFSHKKRAEYLERAIYEFGFTGGKSFGLTIAALGFLSGSFGGVIHLTIMKRRGKLSTKSGKALLNRENAERENEVPMQESIDKMTIRIALIVLAYAIAFLGMQLPGTLLTSMKATVFGFNFLLGVLSATLFKFLIRFLRKSGIMKKDYVNDFLMTRLSNFCFDLMIVAGIAAIRPDVLQNYWGVILILAVVGLIITYIYNRIVVNILFKLFKHYKEEQFLAMFGMLTGTAGTGIILLREIDGESETPAADNPVYQNFPAIVFGFPIMLLATFAPGQPLLTLGILVLFFIVMNVILFRSKIFQKRKNKEFV